ncbi:uncharacterized protein BCR38DRAFT_397695 [Pseudomassariella vexata]|uniref:Pericentrin/AKAP-450 centrosomal targeting domain-containing protein n=1 Tax=Pseudomassariella vexata TaxID=1141098 RepID=A0A1Y2DNW6_9PEZI|nr:uncharacterized protein BCR38DRAFT_397695 [Pseudomassariella vexata]ORY60907.1 hypothetical protein BCR38DRAFT_397695 [Pseudomassariella vexata]
MQWMQARWEREAKLRNDAAFAKRFLELQLSLAEACNKADLRILSQIHQKLGIKSPDALLSASKASNPESKSLTLRKHQPPTRAQHNLMIFATAVRAIVRMQVSARAWGKHEKTRVRLVEAWEETKRREPAARKWDGNESLNRSNSGRGDGRGNNGSMHAEKREERKRSTAETTSDMDDADPCVEVRV